MSRGGGNWCGNVYSTTGPIVAIPDRSEYDDPAAQAVLANWQNISAGARDIILTCETDEFPHPACGFLPRV